MRQTVAKFFGAKFVVKYILALNVFSAGLAFSAVTLAVSEPFLLPAAENWSPGWRSILALNS
jgi:hypothetical protein